jgi:hypothetical protein
LDFVVRRPRGAAGQGRAGQSDAAEDRAEPAEPDDDGDDEEPAFELPFAEDDEFAELFASVDAAVLRANKTLAGERRPRRPPPIAICSSTTATGTRTRASRNGAESSIRPATCRRR